MSDPWLIVETSGRPGRVGLARGGRVVSERVLDDGRRHARDLAEVIRAILAADGLKAADLTGVMASVGPGGYTGLRVGLTTAKTIAFAVGCPFVAVPTFDAIASRMPCEVERVVVIGDALQGQAYWQEFGWPAKGTVRQGWDDVDIVAATAKFASVPSGAWITGPAVELFRQLIMATNPIAPPELRTPSIEAVYAVGNATQPLSRDGLLRLEPLYLRGSSAEEKAARGG